MALKLVPLPQDPAPDQDSNSISQPLRFMVDKVIIDAADRGILHRSLERIEVAEIQKAVAKKLHVANIFSSFSVDRKNEVSAAVHDVLRSMREREGHLQVVEPDGFDENDDLLS